MTWFWQPLAPTGVAGVSGTAALSVPQPAVAASGTYTPPPITGTAALSVTQPTIAASGKLKYSGSAALSVTAPSIAATGVLKYAGTAALSVTAPSIAATGVLKYVGTAALAVPVPSIAGSGAVSGGAISGTAALSVPMPVVAGLGTVTAPPAPPIEGGTGGPAAKRRRFVLDLKHPEPKEPKRKQPARRIPAIHAALSLTSPFPVLSVTASVAELLPVTARLALRRPALPMPSWEVEVTSLLGLANERVEELEAALAAVLED